MAGKGRKKTTQCPPVVDDSSTLPGIFNAINRFHTDLSVRV